MLILWKNFNNISSPLPDDKDVVSEPWRDMARILDKVLAT